MFREYDDIDLKRKYGLLLSKEDARGLRYAYAASEDGTCSRLKVGAALMREGVLLGTGYNGAPSGESHCDHWSTEGGDGPGPCQRSVHAEINAIVNAAVEGHATKGADMFLTHSPCYACAGMMINARIARVVYDLPYRSTAGINRLISRGIEVVCNGDTGVGG